MCSRPMPVPASQRISAVALDAPVVAVDYGYVNLNYDKAWFAKSGLALPRTLDDLAQPAYRNLLVVQNPATSSAGYAFMLATIAGLGEEAAFDWWARMRANGLKVAKGWSEAYYTEFTRNGGSRPIVVSYASSPAAEVFYSKEKISEPPTASLFLKGGVFRQVEGVALVKGGQQREAAGQFIEFMRSPAVQEALQTTMWMYAAEPRTPRPEVLRHAPEPAAFDNPSQAQIALRCARMGQPLDAGRAEVAHQRLTESGSGFGARRNTGPARADALAGLRTAAVPAGGDAGAVAAHRS